MPRDYAYPPDLVRYVVTNWPSESPLGFSEKHLDQALSAAFQASLTTEEGRPTRFRLLLAPVESLPESGVPNEGVLRLRFAASRPLVSDELRRLSPAAPFETSLIGAHEEDDQLRIWGVAHSGPAWLAPTWGGRAIVPIWSRDPIVHVSGPGKIAVRSAGKLVGAIERGVVVDATMDVFESSWLRSLFERERSEARDAHDAGQASAASPTTVELSLIGRVSQQMLRRAIQIVRGARHGGMILFTDVPEGAASIRGLRLKYGVNQDEPSRRYRTLLLQILEAVAAATTKPIVGWADFALDESPVLERLEQRVFEHSRAIANLTAIDGAVVLDKRFGLVGFGAEVSAELPSPSVVHRALDVEGEHTEPEDVENVGTRHRAAYRFANEHPDGLAIVISQDGGVTFVAKREDRVVAWEQSVGP
ncbi:MAG TPA: hypothetical protein VHE30_01305 [Polyangiaceae bacterium]|nr:hypothetical protein [Polyangiaceae bacterium]